MAPSFPPGNRFKEIMQNLLQNRDPVGSVYSVEHLKPVVKQVMQLVKQLTPLSLKIFPEMTEISTQSSSDRNKNAGTFSLDSISIQILCNWLKKTKKTKDEYIKNKSNSKVIFN